MPGHEGITGNKRADVEAKKAASREMSARRAPANTTQKENPGGQVSGLPGIQEENSEKLGGVVSQTPRDITA